MKMAEKIPTQVLEAMRDTLRDTHYDENAGVPIGARLMAFAVLGCYEDRAENAAILKLGTNFDSPVEWAREHCMNPVREIRGK
jgi:hypothetical protein